MSENVEAVFDLDSFGLHETAVYKVHRDGKPGELIGLEITVCGDAHPAFEKFMEGEFRFWKGEAEAAAAAKEKAEKNGTKVPVKEYSIAEQREMNMRSIAARVLSANMPIMFRGQKVTLGPTNALTVLSDPKFLWLGTQIGEFASERANFIPGSAQQ